jgi:CBS domain-containing protein
MRMLSNSLVTLTAGDLMNSDVVRLPERMPLHDAARLLLRNQISGAPVVDSQGRCVGVFSAIDYLRQAEGQTKSKYLQPGPCLQSITCSHQVKHWARDGCEVALCTLPAGACPIQVDREKPDGEHLRVCGDPHCVPVDWQTVDEEALPADEVRRFMTPDPVTAPATLPIRALARMMIDAHIHRVIVVDDERRAVGIVSNTDILAALAYSDDEI